MTGLADYAGLTGTIEDYLERADLAGRVPTFVTLAETRLDRRLDLADGETATTLPLAGGMSPLPDDFRAWRSVSGRRGKRYGYVTPQVFAENYADTGWSWWGRAFTIQGSIPGSEAPDGSDAWVFGLDNPFIKVSSGGEAEVALIYRRGIPPLGPARPTNWLLDRSPDLYLYAALMEAAPFLRDDARLATWSGLLEAAIADVTRLDRDARWGRARMTTSGPTP